MAIADHAIADRAISAPEESVFVGVFAVGRVVVSTRPATAVALADGPANDVIAFDSPASLVILADAPAA